MKKLLIFITTLFVIGIMSCNYNPMDITNKIIPASTLIDAHEMVIKNPTIDTGDLFIIHGQDPDRYNYDYVFIVSPKTGKVTLHAKYYTNDTADTIGVTLIISMAVGLFFGGLIIYKTQHKS